MHKKRSAVPVPANYCSISLESTQTPVQTHAVVCLGERPTGVGLQ